MRTPRALVIRMADALTRLAKPKVVIGLAALTTAACHRRPGVGARLLVSVPLTVVASNVLKRLIARQRPRLWDRHPRESFPSSHSSAATAYLLALLDSFAAWWALPLAGGAIAAVNVARVRDREHWPTDVLCGDLLGVLGAAAGGITARVWLRHRRSKPARGPDLASRGNMGTARTTRTAAVDVLELLQSQHREVDELIEKLEQGTGDARALFGELADKLAAHATVEERIFYPQSMSSETSDMLHESVEEHLVVKRLLADMLTLDPSSDEFTAKLSVLKEAVSHHAHEEEEGKLFPKLRTLLDADQRAAIGNEVLALFEQLLPKHPAQNLPAETAEAAPLPAAR